MDLYDLSSSPDPLNDDSIYTSPMKDKQLSQRKRSVSIRPGSPRKQTFELELGDRISPQKIRVTVEADSSNKENRARVYKSIEASESPTRKPRRRKGSTITTTVPLKGLTDEEDNGTTPTTKPKTKETAKRALRSSNGTPVARRSRKMVLTPAAGNNESQSVTVDATPVPRGVKSTKSLEIGKVESVSTTPATGIRESFVMTSQITNDFADVDSVDYMQDEATPILDDNDHTTSMPRPNRNSTEPPQDVLLADFQREKTPSHTGWSSPQPSSWKRHVTSGTAQAVMNDPTSWISSPAPHDSLNTFDNTRQESRNNMHHESDEEEDRNSNIDEEGFTMIAMDTVKSFHKQSTIDENLATSKLVRTPQLSSKAPGMNGTLRDVSSFDATSVISAAMTPSRTSMFRDSIADTVPVREPSFNSIESRTQDAASPGRALPTPRARPVLDRVSSIESDLPPSRTPVRTPKPATPKAQALSHVAFQRLLQHDRGDDSFSSIPAEILEAASPEKRHSSHVARPESTPHIEGYTTLESIQPIPIDETMQPVFALNSTQLISPTATASVRDSHGNGAVDEDEEVASDAESSSRHSRRSTSFIHDQSAMASHVGSSPPTARPPTHSNSLAESPDKLSPIKETPTILFSSPTLPPPPAAAKTVAHDIEPDFPSIVRAGMKLQNISNAPVQSHRSSSHLGSPFRRSSPSRKSDSTHKSPLQHGVGNDHDLKQDHQSSRRNMDLLREQARNSLPPNAFRFLHQSINIAPTTKSTNNAPHDGPQRPSQIEAIPSAQADTAPGRVTQKDSNLAPLTTSKNSKPQPENVESAVRQEPKQSTRTPASSIANIARKTQDKHQQVLSQTTTDSNVSGLNDDQAKTGLQRQLPTARGRAGPRPEFNAEVLSRLRKEREERRALKNAQSQEQTSFSKSQDAHSTSQAPNHAHPNFQPPLTSGNDLDILHNVLMNSETDHVDDGIPDNDNGNEDDVDIWMEEYRNSSLLENNHAENHDIETPASITSSVQSTPSNNGDDPHSSTSQHGEDRSKIVQMKETARRGYDKHQTPETERDSEERRLEYMSSVPQLETSRILESINSADDQAQDVTPRASTNTVRQYESSTSSSRRFTNTRGTVLTSQRQTEQLTPKAMNGGLLQSNLSHHDESESNHDTDGIPTILNDARRSKKRAHERSVDNSPSSLSQDSRDASRRGRKIRRLSSHSTVTEMSGYASQSSRLHDTILKDIPNSNVANQTLPLSRIPRSVGDNSKIDVQSYIKVAIPSSELGDISGLSQLHESTQLAMSTHRRRTQPIQARYHKLFESSPAPPPASQTRISGSTTIKSRNMSGAIHTSIPSPPTSQEKDSVDERNSSFSTQQDAPTGREDCQARVFGDDYVRESIEEDSSEDEVGHSETLEDGNDEFDAEDQLDMEQEYAQSNAAEEESVREEEDEDGMSETREVESEHEANQDMDSDANMNDDLDEENHDDEFTEQASIAHSQPETPEPSSLVYSLLDNVAPLAPSAQTSSPQKSCIRNPLFPNLPKRSISWKQNTSLTQDSSFASQSTSTLSASSQLLSRHPRQLYPAHPSAPSPSNPAHLSSTKWTRRHWQMLERILLDIRASLPLDAELEAEYTHSPLLGRWMTGCGESMRIEAWHLDVVACFGDYCAGWEELGLMRRVFGLVVGEERRVRREAGEAVV